MEAFARSRIIWPMSISVQKMTAVVIHENTYMLVLPSDLGTMKIERIRSRRVITQSVIKRTIRLRALYIDTSIVRNYKTSIPYFRHIWGINGVYREKIRLKC